MMKVILMINLLVLDVLCFTMFYCLKKNISKLKNNEFFKSILGSDKK